MARGTQSSPYRAARTFRGSSRRFLCFWFRSGWVPTWFDLSLTSEAPDSYLPHRRWPLAIDRRFMQDLLVLLSMGVVVGLLLCFGLRKQFRAWNEQSVPMKAILFVLAFKTAAVIVGFLVVLIVLLM